MRRAFLLLGLMSCCAASDQVQVSWNGREFRAAWVNPVDDPPPGPPNGSTRVVGKAIKLSLPFLNSPSIAGEHAYVVFEVGMGRVPGRPECLRVRLDFDSYSNPFRVGEEYVLIFLPDGRFWSIEGLYF